MLGLALGLRNRLIHGYDRLVDSVVVATVRGDLPRLQGWLIVLDAGQQGGTGHAVAAQHDAQGNVHFFDPNYGHFNFPDFARFKTWFRAFLIESGYIRDYAGAQFFCVV